MSPVRTREERPREAGALAAVGGFLDAYTFLAHGGVFANAQTGNVILFGIAAGQGDWPAAARRLPPLGAFVVGVITVELLARMRGRRLFSRPARLVLIVESVTFVVVGLLPGGTPDWVSTVLVAWAATMQVVTFRTVRHAPYSTTFTTGNLRSLLSETAAWLGDHDTAARDRARALTVVVACFVVGAVLGGLATDRLGNPAVILVVPVLLLVLVSLVVDTRRLTRAATPAAVPTAPTTEETP